jgi:hypothetical protein
MPRPQVVRSGANSVRRRWVKVVWSVSEVVFPAATTVKNGHADQIGLDDAKLPLHLGGVFAFWEYYTTPPQAKQKHIKLLVSPLETTHFCLIQESIVCTDQVTKVRVEELPKSFLGPSFQL